MAAKTKRKKASRRRKKIISKTPLCIPKSGDPDYMVQVSDPTMLRKDLLETLREVIIFMQGYEKFRKIQEEKASIIVQLKEHVKELERMIDNKLRGYFPKGKLNPVRALEQKEEENETERMPPYAQGMIPPQGAAPINSNKPQSEQQPDDLADLEAQLRDIENELKSIS